MDSGSGCTSTHLLGGVCFSGVVTSLGVNACRQDHHRHHGFDRIVCCKCTAALHLILLVAQEAKTWNCP
jgi:hypothetical protein